MAKAKADVATKKGAAEGATVGAAVKTAPAKGDNTKVIIVVVLVVAALIGTPVLLGIFTGVAQNIGDMSYGTLCVSSPINELVTKMQKAEGGIVTMTSQICMYAGEVFKVNALTSKINNVQSVTFECKVASVCASRGPLSITSDSITAVADAKFKCRISCEQTASRDYDCTIEIVDA